MRWLPLLLPILAACGGDLPPVCSDSADPTPSPILVDPQVTLLTRAHAHNDYEHGRPLEDALAAGFHSVEVDVFFADGRFEVSHYGVFPKGTLEGLYLRPLQDKVDRDGFVQPRGAPFTLWVDLKNSNAELVEALHGLLDEFSMLTVFDDSTGVEQGPVTMVLTGDAAMKEAFVQARSRRRAIRDSNDFSPDDPPGDSRWGYYALNWSAYLDWNGAGAIPQAQSERLACIVNAAHRLGRKVRFYNAPDREEVWDAWIDHGVDFLHTDDLEGLNRYLVLRSPERSGR